MDICPIPLGKVLVMAAGLLWLASANFLAEVQARCVSVFHTRDGRQNMLCTSATNPAASQVLCAYPCPWLHPSLACYTPSLPSPLHYPMQILPAPAYASLETGAGEMVQDLLPVSLQCALQHVYDSVCWLASYCSSTWIVLQKTFIQTLQPAWPNVTIKCLSIASAFDW